MKSRLRHKVYGSLFKLLALAAALCAAYSAFNGSPSGDGQADGTETCLPSAGGDSAQVCNPLAGCDGGC